MKAALVYTSTTPELIALVEEEVRKNLGGEAELLSLEDASILSEVRAAGTVTGPAAARLVGMYMRAVSEGADAILNICSSVGEVADAAQDIARYTGVPIVRVDEEMCREAVRRGSRIGVLATLPTTLRPTKNTILRVAREMGRQVECVDGLMEVFGADPDTFRGALLTKAGELTERVDVILLAQGSMAYVERDIEQAYGKPTFSSPRFGAAELRKALEGKGLC